MAIESLVGRPVQTELDPDTRESLKQAGMSHINNALDWQQTNHDKWPQMSHYVPVFDFIRKSFPDQIPFELPEKYASLFFTYKSRPANSNIVRFIHQTDVELESSVIQFIQANQAQNPEAISAAGIVLDKSLDQSNKKRYNHVAIEGNNLLGVAEILHANGFDATDFLNKAMEESEDIEAKHPDDKMPNFTRAVLYSNIVFVASNGGYFDIAQKAVDKLVEDYHSPDGGSIEFTVAEAFAYLGVAEIKAANS